MATEQQRLVAQSPSAKNTFSLTPPVPRRPTKPLPFRATQQENRKNSTVFVLQTYIVLASLIIICTFISVQGVQETWEMNSAECCARPCFVRIEQLSCVPRSQQRQRSFRVGFLRNPTYSLWGRSLRVAKLIPSLLEHYQVGDPCVDRGPSAEEQLPRWKPWLWCAKTRYALRNSENI